MRIVVGVDGSPQASAGVAWVAQLPLSGADEVLVVAVAQQPALFGAWGNIHTTATVARLEAAWTEVRDAAHRAASDAADLLAQRGCPTRTVVIDGHPVEALGRTARESGAELLVVGPHGRGRLESILLGSVSQGLLHEMPAPVLIAREPIRAPVRVLLATDGSDHSLEAARYLGRFPLPPAHGSTSSP